MQKNPLASKVALITGAARRIGAEIAKKLHAEGMNVVIHYHASENEAVKLAESLNQLRPQSAVLACADLQAADIEGTLISKAVTAWGRLDVLVNNASRFYRTAIGKVTDYAWDDLINSNVKAPFFLAQAAAPHLKATQGSIVNMTDIHAERPMKDYAVYCISKSGLLMATRALAKELAPDIRVNAVAPGPVLWPEGDNALLEDEKKAIIEKSLLKRAGSADDIARAV
jgi:pteridine reductase